MKNELKILLIVGLVSAAIVLESAFMVDAQQLPNKNDQIDRAKELRKKLEENGDPISAYNMPESTSPKERAVRQIRNRKFNTPVKVVTLEEERQDLLIFSSVDVGVEPAFPNKSNFVAIGTVTSANAFVSEDKTAVFGEFNFKVSRILKNTTEWKKQDEITINRYGGKVLMPSGKIIYRIVDGLYLPKIGKTYLMFLKYDAETQTYGIITGYQFKEGKIESLDGVSLFGYLTEQFRNYPKFNGMKTSDFIELVLSNIIQNRIK